MDFKDVARSPKKYHLDPGEKYKLGTEIGSGEKFQPCFRDLLNFPLESDIKLHSGLRKRQSASYALGSTLTEEASFCQTGIS